MSSIKDKQHLLGSEEKDKVVDKSIDESTLNNLNNSTLSARDQKGGSGRGNNADGVVKKDKDASVDCKEDDEDKIMELITQKNQKLEEHQDIIDHIHLNQGSQISLSRIKSQPSDSIHITSSQLQLQQNNEYQIMNANAIPSLSNLARQRYISTEIDQQSSNQNNNNNNTNNNINNNFNTNNQNDPKNIPAQFMNTRSKYAARAAALGQGGNQQNQNDNASTAQQPDNANQQYQIGFYGHNQQTQFKNPPPRSQIQYQSGLSSSQSLTIQRDFHIYFQIGYGSSRSGSSNYESSYDQEEESLMITQATNEPVRVPIDDQHEESTVQDAILSAICQVNNLFSIQKINIRLAYDENLYDLFLAKKNGEKKSLPALYPLEKMRKFNNSNMVLIPRDASAIIRPQQSVNSPTKVKSNVSKNGNGNEPKLANREIIKEVSESMISNKSVEIAPAANNRNGSSSFIKNKNSSSFMGYPTQGGNPNTRRSIQSTITPKQTKIGIEERDQGGDTPIQSPSKCSFLMCCVRGSGSSSSNKSSNNTQSGSSKKRPTVVSS